MGVPLLAIATSAASLPTVTAIIPFSGSTAGSQVETITGTGFVVGATTIAFGSTAGTSVSCTSSTTCVTTSPAGAAGVVDITITTPGGTSPTTTSDQFTYAVYAYVANGDGNNVSVISTATNTVTATVPVGGGPIGVSITPNGLYVYVANSIGNTVSVISTATNTVTATVPVGDFPVDVSITPNGFYAYVTNYLSKNVSVISTATNTVTATDPVGRGPDGVSFTPNGLYAYVTNYFSNNVSVIRTATNTVTATVPVHPNPEDVAITPNGSYVYVAGGYFNIVSVIRTATNTVTATVPVGRGPDDVSITPNGLYAYVTNFGLQGQMTNGPSSNVSVISTATNTVSATVPVGGAPASVSIAPNGLYAYVANKSSNNVSVISTATNTVTATVPVGGGPDGVSITPNGPYVALGDSYSSGEANPPFVTPNRGCNRSAAQAWPLYVAASTNNYSAVHVIACSGAKISSLTRGFNGEVAQDTAMAAFHPSLVTVTIGGNSMIVGSGGKHDWGFAQILFNCYVGVLSQCHNAIVKAQSAVLGTDTAKYGESLLSRLTRAFGELRTAEPNAKILVVGYPDIFSPATTGALRYCPWLNTSGNVKGLRTLASNLDTIEHDAAIAAHVEYASTLNVLSRNGVNHELCTSDSWIQAINHSSGSSAGHPHALGQKTIANAVEAYLQAHP
jgi:YVTN family beta-propeller protein